MATDTTPAFADYGRRLLTNLIEEIASTTPQRIFVSVQGPDPSTTAFEDITYHAFANAINKCSWWLENKLRGSVCTRTVAYIGPQDLLYPILVIACIKTGYKVSCPLAKDHPVLFRGKDRG